ncbi:MAG TPA: branched-chain amino acid ABC transporter permease, partial [Actinomycetota bacterium]|nr:branched-chain amino acid ABC transporter permease [Actinomycetota bacterium]
MDRLIAALLAGITDGASFGLIALGIVLVYKATRVLNFAQAEIGTLALYVEWELWRLGVPVFIALIVALVFAAAMGAGVEYVLRPLAAAPRLTVTVATLGIATFLGAYQILRFSTDPHNAPELAPGTLFTLGTTDFRAGRVLAFFVTAGLGLALYTFFKRSLFGLGVLAAAQDQKALQLMGLPLNTVSVFTWAAGAVLTALAGMILMPTIGSFTPFAMTLIMIPSLAAA